MDDFGNESSWSLDTQQALTANVAASRGSRRFLDNTSTSSMIDLRRLRGFEIHSGQ